MLSGSKFASKYTEMRDDLTVANRTGDEIRVSSTPPRRPRLQSTSKRVGGRALLAADSEAFAFVADYVFASHHGEPLPGAEPVEPTATAEQKVKHDRLAAEHAVGVVEEAIDEAFDSLVSQGSDRDKRTGVVATMALATAVQHHAEDLLAAAEEPMPQHAHPQALGAVALSPAQ